VHFFSALVVVSVYYLAVYVLFSAVGLGLPIIVAIGAILPVVLYVSYGYSPLCFPTIPVCFYDDILWSLQQFMPKHIELPAVWYKNETCASYNKTMATMAPCIRKCSDRPFSYIEWYDPLSWWAVDFNFHTGLAWATTDMIVTMSGDVSAYSNQRAAHGRWKKGLSCFPSSNMVSTTPHLAPPRQPLHHRHAVYRDALARVPGHRPRRHSRECPTT
jgi:hypothetical protein